MAAICRGAPVHTVEGVDNRFIQCDVSISRTDSRGDVDHRVLETTVKVPSLVISNQPVPFRTAHQITLMHHRNKFGHTRLSSSETILWTKPDRQTDRQTRGQTDTGIPVHKDKLRRNATLNQFWEQKSKALPRSRFYKRIKLSLVSSGHKPVRVNRTSQF